LLVGATHIGRLLSRPRLWGIRAMRRGRFGPPVTAPDGARRVPLAAVEDAAGIPFTPAQLTAARLYLPQHEEDEADGPAVTA
jgi:hypothetical protein